MHRLHVPTQLRKTLASTNVIESAFSIVEQVCRNVKRWHGGDQRERWVGSGLLVAEKQFRRVTGLRGSRYSLRSSGHSRDLAWTRCERSLHKNNHLASCQFFIFHSAADRPGGKPDLEKNIVLVSAGTARIKESADAYARSDQRDSPPSLGREMVAAQNRAPSAHRPPDDGQVSGNVPRRRRPAASAPASSIPLSRPSPSCCSRTPSRQRARHRATACSLWATTAASRLSRIICAAVRKSSVARRAYVRMEPAPASVSISTGATSAHCCTTARRASFMRFAWSNATAARCIWSSRTAKVSRPSSAVTSMPSSACPACARELWFDNLATAVAEHEGNLVRFNPRFLAFAREYGFIPRACHVAAAWEKGKVERAIGYVRQNFWPLRSFSRSGRCQRTSAQMAG